mgnify:CR=1 FL=1
MPESGLPSRSNAFRGTLPVSRTHAQRLTMDAVPMKFNSIRVGFAILLVVCATAQTASRPAGNRGPVADVSAASACSDHFAGHQPGYALDVVVVSMLSFPTAIRSLMLLTRW